MNIKKLFYSLIHIFFLSGILYAFQHFIKTPKSIMEIRRMWAYESWIILSFYTLFIFLIFTEKDISLVKERIRQKILFFNRIIIINLILLIFPWGLFLILAPQDLMLMLRLNSLYWKILGLFSLLGALLYYLPFKFYKAKFSYYILLFGFIDNLLAGIIVSILFLNHKIPLLAFSSVPLLFYFAYFFYDQTKKYHRLIKEIQN